jgi:hypothetical protein
LMVQMRKTFYHPLSQFECNNFELFIILHLFSKAPQLRYSCSG